MRLQVLATARWFRCFRLLLQTARFESESLSSDVSGAFGAADRTSPPHLLFLIGDRLVTDWCSHHVTCTDCPIANSRIAQNNVPRSCLNKSTGHLPRNAFHYVFSFEFWIGVKEPQ